MVTHTNISTTVYLIYLRGVDDCIRAYGRDTLPRFKPWNKLFIIGVTMFTIDVFSHSGKYGSDQQSRHNKIDFFPVCFASCQHNTITLTAAGLVIYIY